MEMHGEGAAHSRTDESGTKIERDSFEPPVQEYKKKKYNQWKLNIAN